MLIEPNAFASQKNQLNCVILSLAINWQFSRIDHNGSLKHVSVMSLSSCRYTSNTLKNGGFLAYFMRILNYCVVYKFQTVNPGCPPSQSHTFSARLLFDETFAQPDISAVVNRPRIPLLFVFTLICFLGSIWVSRFSYENDG